MANRKPYTIQLTRGRDDDLISAIEGIPEGQRNAALKEALRVGLNTTSTTPAGPPDLADVRDDLAWVKQALTDMPGWIDQRLSKLSIKEVTNGHNGDGPRLSQDEINRVAAKMKKAKW